MESLSFRVDVQPKPNYHFRYESELSVKHGCLQGMAKEGASPTENVFPSISLTLHEGHDPIYVLVSLHTTKGKRIAPQILHARSSEKLEYDFIFEEMKRSPSNNSLLFEWELKDYMIVRLKKSEESKAMQKKQQCFESLKLPLGYAELQNDTAGSKTTEKGVCLGFTLFKRSGETFTLFRNTIYSNNILDNDDLTILQVAPKRASFRGGEQVLIVINIPTKYKYGVRMYRKGRGGETNELTLEPIMRIQRVLQFETPPMQLNNWDANVFLEVFVEGTAYKSERFGFTYNYCTHCDPVTDMQSEEEELGVISSSNIPLTNDSNADYEPMEQTYAELRPCTSQMTSDYGRRPEQDAQEGLFMPAAVSAENLPQTFDINNEMDFQKVTSYIFTDSVRPTYEYETDFLNLTEIYKRCGNQKCTKALDTKDMKFAGPDCKIVKLSSEPNSSKARKYKENIDRASACQGSELHTACLQNKSDTIASLVGQPGQKLHGQDKRGKTPLHLAIENGSKDAILFFQNLFEGNGKYTLTEEEELRQLLHVQCNEGLTVLDAAINADQKKLVEAILIFCKSHGLNDIVGKISKYLAQELNSSEKLELEMSKLSFQD